MAGPEDLDTITRSDERDSWAGGPSPRPEDLDIETKSVETDSWGSGPPQRPDGLDTETAAVETDGWIRDTALSAVMSVGPLPRPEDLDIITFDDNERDQWA
ncbi:hypothetical protein NBH00_18750 [Paraconexibacter antarcticus]|uniref:Uncharacterized protein n=1 Tax=Paraconexibacter antarcticus TaxID=2949664 RepID=A0ABY5DN00_9ACTN|nr:hypothetical protein [Paraconexibacter antarcticus]UTI63378.1 hypothetical protein NBH00_18750 [Paraconexibacter antarcticus]